MLNRRKPKARQSNLNTVVRERQEKRNSVKACREAGDALTVRFPHGLLRSKLIVATATFDSAPSSRGLGHRPFTAVTRVRFP